MEYQVTGHDHWYSDAFLLQRQIGCTLSALVGRRMEQQQLSSFLLMLVVTGPFMLSKAHSSATPDTAGMSGELKVFEGESLRISLFCGQENLNLEKVWCKEELQKGCLNTEPLIFSEPEWRVLTMASNEKVRLGNPKRGCASVHMASVKAEDSGLYWFGLLDGQKIYDLTPVKMVVRKGLKNNGNVTVTKEHKPSVSRVVQIGIATVAAISVFTFIITLVVLMLTKRNVRVPSRRSGR